MSTSTKEVEMTGHLIHDAHMTRLDELQRRAEHRRLTSASAAHRTEEPMHATQSISIRRATAADAGAVRRLAALDSAPTPGGELLIAEVQGEPHAALEISSGVAIADPFRPTAELVELLRLRAMALRAAVEPVRRLPRLRAAFRIA